MKLTRWSLAVLGASAVVGLLAASGGLAASIPVTSKNLTTSRTCVLVMTSSAGGIDAGVRQGSANSNFGTQTSAHVATAAVLGDNRRTYVKPDLAACNPDIPSTATVASATLRLNASSVPGGLAGCRTHHIFRVGSAWTETGITWNNQPSGTTLDQPPAGEATSSMEIGAACSTNGGTGYVTGWNVTTDVAAWATGVAANNGWMIREGNEGQLLGPSSTYLTRETNNVTQGPWLVITYVP